MKDGIIFDYSLSGVNSEKIEALLPEIEIAHDLLHKGTGLGH